MKNEQQRLLHQIQTRAIENPGLRQTIQFFMISNQNNDLVRQIWRHSAFMISLSSSKNIESSLDDEYFIPERHKRLSRKKSSGLVTHHLYDLNEDEEDNKDRFNSEANSSSESEANSMELDLSKVPSVHQHQQAHYPIKRRGSFTTDDLNIEELQGLLLDSNQFDKENKRNNMKQHFRNKSSLSLNKNQNNQKNNSKNHPRRRFTRSYIQQFNDNVEVFKWMLDAPVGCEFEADSNSQEICDPIHDNQQIVRMEVKKIFQSAARPVLVETFDKESQSIGQFIIKAGDDLRQDENMMFMFQFSYTYLRSNI